MATVAHFNDAFRPEPDYLESQLNAASEKTLSFIEELDPKHLSPPFLATMNPPLWELGHVAFFYDRMALQLMGDQIVRLKGAEALFDSIGVPHEVRWDLPVPTKVRVFEYYKSVKKKAVEYCERTQEEPLTAYLLQLAVNHETMHSEAFTYTRQTLDCPKPNLEYTPEAPKTECRKEDVKVPGGVLLLGASKEEPFVYDNEKWAHEVEVKPFEIANTPVTNEEFREFVDDKGYERDALWNYSGQFWLKQSKAKHPLYWKKEGGRWLEKEFDRWAPLEADLPVVFVNWHEANAYCRWAGRRLPTEAEWEWAARGKKHCSREQFPWGNQLTKSPPANLDHRYGKRTSVFAFPEGDSPFGCRQMIGNVWEWTSTAFFPFPGYLVDKPYREYSATSFGYHKVLKGGCWATNRHLIRIGYRNFYLPDRRDIFAGFRTCAGER